MGNKNVWESYNLWDGIRIVRRSGKYTSKTAEPLDVELDFCVESESATAEEDAIIMININKVFILFLTFIIQKFFHKVIIF